MELNEDYLEINANGNYMTDLDLERALKTVDPKGYAEKKKRNYNEDDEEKLTETQVNERRKEAIKAFEFFDKDGTGFVNSSELRSLFKIFYSDSLTDEQIDNFLMEAELDENGQINYKNFVYLMIK